MDTDARELRVRLGALVALAAAHALSCGGAEQRAQKPIFAAPAGGIFQPPLPVVTTTDDDLLPTMAPGSNRIVYAAKASGNLDIYVRDLATSGSRRLTTHSTDDTDPCFAPDGRRIAWVSQAEDVKGDIWMMDADGGDKTQLTGRDSSDRAPAWDTDGRRIYFGTRPRGVTRERIDVIDIDTGERATVVEGGWDPAISPSGDELFYAALDERQQPRLFAYDLRGGRTAALTDGAYVEGLPRAIELGGKVVVVFTRFVDDRSGDGNADADDPPSIWAVDFDRAIFGGAAPARPRPLTAGGDGEIFATPVDDWLVYTAAGVTDLDIYALPISGMVSADAGPAAVLEGARAEQRPAMRRLALRYLVATNPALEGKARYELARDLAERGAYSDAIDEHRRVTELASGEELGTIAALEVERLRMLDRLRGVLIVREQTERRFVQARLTDVERIAGERPEAPAVQIRANSIRAEADYALGARQRAVASFEEIAATADVPPEDGARALGRLGQIYGEMRDLSAVERVTVRLLRSYGSERYLAEQAAAHWVELAAGSEAVKPLAALEEIVRDYADLPVVAARAARAQALIQARIGDVDSATEQWQLIADTFGTERQVLAEALTTLAATFAGQGRGEETLDVYERILAEFPGDGQLRTLARQGITRMALLDAQRAEQRARAVRDPGAQVKLLERARRIYRRLLRNNPELIIAHRRYISLSAELGAINRVLGEYAAKAQINPRDKYARYGHAYATLHLRPTPFDDALDELEEVVAIDPRFAAAHLSIGWVQEQLEQIEPDEGWLEQAADSANLVLRLLKPLGEVEPNAEDASLIAAAELNKGNALFKLGITDAALLAYLERELSGVPFSSPVTESLFRESFARVAASEEAFDVALDQAYAAHRLTRRRKGATAALIAALNLQVAIAAPNAAIAASRYTDAVEWYDVAIATYQERADWSRVVPMLRGKGVALRGRGEYGEALAVFEELIAILDRGQGPGVLEHPGVGGLIVTEIPADSDDVTRAKYGFSGAQEAELAQSAAARIYQRWGDTEVAQRYTARRLTMLALEVAEPDVGERVREEYLAALNEAALAQVRGGRPTLAITHWQRALDLAGELGRWSEGLTILESMQALALEDARQGGSAMAQSIIDAAATAARQVMGEQPPELQRRFARWSSLEQLRRAVAAPRRAVASSPAGLQAMLGHLDAAESATAKAHTLAREADREELEAAIAAYRGVEAQGLIVVEQESDAEADAAEADAEEADDEEETDDAEASREEGAGSGASAGGEAAASPEEDGSAAEEAEIGGEAADPAAEQSPGSEGSGGEGAPPPAPPGGAEVAVELNSWRSAFGRALWDKPEGEHLSREYLQRAIDLFSSKPTPAWAPERGLFLAAAVEALVAEGKIELAWQLLERDRLLGLRPSVARVAGSRFAAGWAVLRKARGTPDYATAVTNAGIMAQALEGHPLPAKTVRVALEGDAILVQAFAPTPGHWHWFLHDSKAVRHFETSSIEADVLPEALREALVGQAPEAPKTVYCDFGELVATPAGGLRIGERTLGEYSEVSEVLSGTYLVAGFALRNLSRGGHLVLQARPGGELELAGSEEEEELELDRSQPLFEQLPARRKLIQFTLPLRGECLGARRPGLRQAVLGEAELASQRIDLDRIAAAGLAANVVLIDAVIEQPGTARALAQGFMLSGVPALLARPAGSARVGSAARQALLVALDDKRLSTIARDSAQRPYRLLGYRGMDFTARVEWVASQYLGLARSSAADYNVAKNRPKALAREDWERARDGFAKIVDFINFLKQPEAIAVLEASTLKLAGGLPASRLPKLLPGHQIMMANFLSQSQQALGEFEAAAAVQQVMIEVQEAAGKKKEVVELLLDLAKTYANAKQMERSRSTFERCVAAATEIGETLVAADCSSRLGSVKRELFDYAGAEESYLTAIAAYQSKDAGNQVYPLRFLGFLYETAFTDYTRALSAFQRALNAAQTYGLTAELPVLHNSIARVYRNRGDYEQALTEVERSGELSASAASAAAERLVKAQEAVVGAEQGVTEAKAAIAIAKADFGRAAPEQRPAAKQTYQLAVKAATKAERLLEARRAEVSATIVDIRRVTGLRSEAELEAARIYWYRGNYARATARQQQSLSLANEARNDYLVIQSLSLAGLIALNQGDLQQAEISMRDALRLSRNTDRKGEEAAQLNNLGKILRQAGRVDEAIASLEAALEIDESLGSSEGRAFDLRNLAIAQLRKGDHRAALANLERSLEISISIGNKFNQLHCLFARGEVLEATADPGAADSYRAAAELALEISVPEVEWTALYALGRLAQGAGDGEQARSRFEAALQVAERLGRGRSESTEEHSRKELYADAIRLAVQDGELATAFAYSERSRARAFLDVLATTPLNVPEARARELLAAELKAREDRIDAERAAAQGAADADERLTAANADHEAARAELMATFPRLGRVLTISPVSIDALRASLPEKVLVLSYFVARQQTTVLVITREQLTAVEIPTGSIRLRAQVTALHRRLRAFLPIDAELATLGESLLAPVRAALAACEVLVILPDGPLHNLPFNGLIIDGEPLLQRWIVAQASSGSMLHDQLVREPAPRPQRVAAFAPADDLPFARLEALELSRGDALLGPAATKSRFISSSAAAVDVAAHGELDPRDPMASALLFSRGADDDARLEVREVFGLRELPSLLSLGACRTTGSVVDGLEWVGLGNAFLTAGARSVIATQARVSDLAAAVVIKRFYRLARDRSVGQALREAALWARQRFEHPAHWASFTLLGDFR